MFLGYPRYRYIIAERGCIVPLIVPCSMVLVCLHRRAAHTLKQLAHFRYSGMAERTRLVASVTAVDGEDTLTLDLSLAGRNHKMLRPQNEPLERTLRRVGLTATKRKGRRGRDSKGEGAIPDVPVVRLLSEREEVPGTTLNREAWREGVELVVGEERFLVLVNRPAVKSLTTSPCVMAGGYSIIAEVRYGVG